MQLPQFWKTFKSGSGCGIAIVLITLLSLLSNVAWHPYLELTTHFRVQYWVISILLFIGVLCQRSKRWIWVCLFSLAIQLEAILPWYLPPSISSTGVNLYPVRILLSNVYFRNQNPHKLLDLVAVEHPDLIVIQEKTAVWITALEPLKSEFPYFFQAPDDIAIWSRLPLQTPTLMGASGQSSIAATVTIANQPVAIVATHPPPPKPNLLQLRNAEFDWVATHIQAQSTPVILIGDLNTTVWSPYYRQLEHTTGLYNTRRGFGILPTWPAPTPYAKSRALLNWLTPLLRIPIDHCLVSPEIRVRSLRLGPNVDSDHLPLIADLLIPGASSHHPEQT
jgi:endonuclease/exonuclease/phosphatase (EEP) superfamily protein YafD